MEYRINKLSELAGISARTLRYYDEIGLLKPNRDTSSGYRVYGQREVDILQQILFYRELDITLDEIKNMLCVPGFDRENALKGHLTELMKKRERLDVLINNVSKSIEAMKGEKVMSDKEKFEGFKKSLIDENERKYGSEIRGKYGDKIVDESNAKLAGLTKEQYDECERIRSEFENTLKTAFDNGDPTGGFAQKACALHEQWLRFFYLEYSKDYHRAMGEMYVSDERFKANYDKLAPGCTEFLRDAINIYCANG